MRMTIEKFLADVTIQRGMFYHPAAARCTDHLDTLWNRVKDSLGLLDDSPLGERQSRWINTNASALHDRCNPQELIGLFNDGRELGELNRYGAHGESSMGMGAFNLSILLALVYMHKERIQEVDPSIRIE